MTATPATDRRDGFVYGLLAYGSWGIFPVYLKAIARTPVLEVLCHRVVWALVLLLAIAWWRDRLAEVGRALRERRTLAALAASTVLIAVNWLVYIYSVVRGRMLEGSLGYYVNPLVNVLLGVLILHETLRRMERVAVALAAAGMVWLALHLGQPPWISLTLAASFGLYGLVRKVAPVGALTGLTVETLLLAPLAAGVLAWRLSAGRAAFLSGDTRLDVLLVLAGPATAFPLLCFAAAARRLPLSTLGFLQYLSPTVQFLLAVLVYGEPFHRAQAGAFVSIWVALALFAYQQLVSARRAGAAASP
jgi:chloramphenicol-sensitive protein RarD